MIRERHSVEPEKSAARRRPRRRKMVRIDVSFEADADAINPLLYYIAAETIIKRHGREAAKALKLGRARDLTPELLLATFFLRETETNS